MTKKTFLSMLVLVALCFTASLQGQKITLTPSMVTQENGEGSATMLVDEQTVAGDPLNGSGGTPSSQWDPQWGAPTYYAYIDLGQTYSISSIYLYDSNSSGNVVVSTGTPGSWTTLFTDAMSNYNSWNQHNVSVLSRYVRVALPQGIGLKEIVIYGSISGGVSVTGVSMSPTSTSLAVGATKQLTATVAPANATNKSVTWSSSNTAIATVNSSGLVSAVAAGLATITVTTVDGAKTATCAVTVTSPVVNVTGVSMSPTSTSILVGATTQLTATVAPANATNKSVTWSSSNTAVAAVNSSGLITAVAVGSTTITVTTVDGAKSATCAVTVTATSGKIALTTSMITQENGAGTATSLVDEQAIAGDPKNGSGGSPNVKWEPQYSLPTYYAYINLGQSYNISHIYIYDSNSTGNVIISSGTPGNWSALFTDGMNNYNAWNAHTVNVTSQYIRVALPQGIGLNEIVMYGSPGAAISVTGVTLSPTTATLTTGATTQLTATVAPSNATNKNVSWSSSNTAVASVNASGLITGIAAGTAIITVTTADGAKTATCAVTVSASNVAVTGVSLSPTSVSINVGATSQIIATVIPTNATNKNVSYSSSNSNVASVNTNGLITGAATGNAIVTVTTADGAKTATCAVTVSAGTSFNGKTADITKATTSPTIDGNIDAIWNTVASNQIAVLTNSGTGAASVSGSWKAVWNASYIYFLFQVTDDVAMNNGANNAAWYIHDCIEVFTDMNNSRTDAEVTNTNGQYQLRFIYGLDAEAIHENPLMTYTQVSKSVAGGYVIEVRFPWSNLTTATMAENAMFGFDVKVTDIDVATGSDPWPSHYEFAWNSAAGKKPINFGRATLVPTDIIAPSAITNLTAGMVGSNKIVLNWTASGDDNNLGKATTYDMRRSTSPITTANFGSATAVSVNLEPAVAGTNQTITVTGLAGSTTYYFAIKAIDEAGNASAISNILTQPTTAPDVIAPAAISNLTTNGVTYSSVLLKWTAPGDDANTGTASSYTIRYSTSIITASNFANATLVNGIPVPAIAGTNQSVLVTGLNPTTTYYFAITTTDEAPNTSAISNIATATTVASAWGSRIVITEDMIINELGIRDARGVFTNLFDEQASITTGAPSSIPTTHWRVSAAGFGNFSGLIIDLGQEYDIKQLYWYEALPYGNNGYDIEIKAGKFRIQTGLPFNWTTQFEQTMVNDAAWHNRSATFRTRYIHLLKISTATYNWSTSGPYAADMPLMEMVIYGTPYGTPPPPVVNPPHQALNIPFDKFIGANSWWYGDTADNNAVGIIRTYQDWKFTKSSSVTTLCDFGGTMDAWYSAIKTKAYEVYPCIQGDVNMTSAKPNYGGASDLPSSYALHADHMFQWAGRYGHNTSLSPSLLRVLPYEVKPPGLGYINYIENWNEQDKTWEGTAGFFSPFEYSAMLSADVDGHMSTMGSTYGAKNADPTMKMVMGGLASSETDYVKTMKLWSDFNRNRDFPADVLNFHHYSNDAGGQGGSATQGISPEADNVKARFETLVSYRNTYLPNKELWVSEYGWDTEENSWQTAKAHSLYGTFGYTAVDLQAMWLVRGYMAASAAGIDRLIMYSLQDAGGGSTFLTCGLVAYNGTKKKSWYYVYTMKNRLKGMSYVGEKASGNSNVLIYKFKSQTGNNGVYAVWCKTSNGTTVNNYNLGFDVATSNAKLVTLANGQINGIESTLTILGNTVNVNVSENPIFIVVNNMNGNALKNASIPDEQMGIDKTNTNGVLVYPNPATTSFNVILDGNSKGTVELYDLTGCLQLKQNIGLGQESCTFNVSNLKSGVYVLRVLRGNTYSYSKLLVE